MVTSLRENAVGSPETLKTTDSRQDRFRVCAEHPLYHFQMVQRVFNQFNDQSHTRALAVPISTYTPAAKLRLYALSVVRLFAQDV
jgi:hypothetical protein